MLTNTSINHESHPPRHQQKTKLQTNKFLLSGNFKIDIVSVFSLPAMYCDWSFLAELLFGFVHLADEVYEALSRLGHTLFGPVDELELPHRPRLAVSRVGHLQNHQGLDQVAVLCALVYLYVP
jgi:hypothetical protein